jgi:lysozyme
MNNQPRISDRGLAVLKQLEALRLVAYQNKGDVPTIGWGHTKGVKLGQTITKAEAERFLREDIAWAEAAVRRALDADQLSSNQFDALVSFVFNIGEPRFRGSTMLTFLKAGDYTAAAAEFGRWIYVDHVISDVQVRRRKVERSLFLGELQWTSTSVA